MTDVIREVTVPDKENRKEEAVQFVCSCLAGKAELVPIPELELPKAPKFCDTVDLSEYTVRTSGQCDRAS